MDYRTLGRTGVHVSPLCLGAVMFGEWGTADHQELIRIIHRALDAGITFIATADVYSHGESEEIVGKALVGDKRDTVVLATKVPGAMGDDSNARGNSRRFGSGRDNSSRRADRLPAQYDLSDPGNQRKLEAVDKLTEVAAQAGLCMVELALAFVRAHPAVTASIIGPRPMERLESQLKTAEITLDAATRDQIDAIVPPGTTVNPVDAGYQPAALTDARLRRRA